LRNLALIIVFLVLISCCALAQEIDYFVPTTTVVADGTAATKISITLEEPMDDLFKITLFDAKVETIETNATFSGFSCEQEESAYGVELSCDVSGSEEKDRSFSIEYDNERIVTQDGANSLLEQDFIIPYRTSNMFIKVILPEGMVIQEGEQFLPSYGSVASDGRRIEIFWRGTDIEANYNIAVKIPYEPLPFSVPIELVIVLILLIGIVLYLLNRKRGSGKAALVMPILKTDEKLVLKGVLNHGDGVNQKILVRESGYSKAKVSKVLKSLQERKIVTLERVGRTNKVYINKNVGKEEQKGSGNS